MPDLTQFIELGATVVVVGLFLLYLLKKDKQAAEKDKRFNNLIANHVTHNTEVLTGLKNTNRELLTFLRRQNGNK